MRTPRPHPITTGAVPISVCGMHRSRRSAPLVLTVLAFGLGAAGCAGQEVAPSAENPSTQSPTPEPEPEPDDPSEQTPEESPDPGDEPSAPEDLPTTDDELDAPDGAFAAIDDISTTVDLAPPLTLAQIEQLERAALADPAAEGHLAVSVGLATQTTETRENGTTVESVSHHRTVGTTDGADLVWVTFDDIAAPPVHASAFSAGPDHIWHEVLPGLRAGVSEAAATALEHRDGEVHLIAPAEGAPLLGVVIEESDGGHVRVAVDGVSGEALSAVDL